MPKSLLYMLISTLCFASANLYNIYLQVILFYCAFSFALISLAYIFEKPQISQKTQTIPLLCFLYLAPYIILAYVSLLLYRVFSKEPLYSQITENIYVGGYPLFHKDIQSIMAFDAILDTTSEWQESRKLRAKNYLCIPVLDGTAPSLSELKRGIDFIHNHATENSKVYVHCALGHGRSVTFVAGYLMRYGGIASIEEAMDKIQKQRPLARLHQAQKLILGLL